MIYIEDVPGLSELLDGLEDTHPVKVAYLSIIDRENRKAYEEEIAKQEYLTATEHPFDNLGPFVLIIYRHQLKYSVPCPRVHDTVTYLHGDDCYCESLVDSRGVEVMNADELYKYGSATYVW